MVGLPAEAAEAGATEAEASRPRTTGARPLQRVRRSKEVPNNHRKADSRAEWQVAE